MEQPNTRRPFEVLEIEGVLNTRGFGGFPISGSPKLITKDCRIVRSGHLGNPSPNGYKQLQTLNISQILDLRHLDEWDKSMHFLGGSRSVAHGVDLDSRRVSIPLRAGKFSASQKLLFYQSRGQDHVKVMAAEYFRLLTSDEGITALRLVLRILLQNPDDGILIRCTMGKDRTGGIFAILLSLAGVPDDEVGKDYGLSQRDLQFIIEPLKLYIHSIDPGIEEKDAAAIALEATKAPAEYILETLRLIREAFGSIEQLICSKCQWQVKDVDTLKSTLICKRGI